MKNSIKLGALALVLSVVVVACGDGNKSKSTSTPDSSATSTVTKVVDTLQKDTTGKVVGEKKDSTKVITKKTEDKK